MSRGWVLADWYTLLVKDLTDRPRVAGYLTKMQFPIMIVPLVEMRCRAPRDQPLFVMKTRPGHPDNVIYVSFDVFDDRWQVIEKLPRVLRFMKGGIVPMPVPLSNVEVRKVAELCGVDHEQLSDNRPRHLPVVVEYKRRPYTKSCLTQPKQQQNIESSGSPLIRPVSSSRI